MNLLSHLAAIVTLPFTVLVLVPTLILKVERALGTNKMFYEQVAIVPVLVGLIFIIFGLIFLVTTIQFFVKVGRGTLAPWDPPENLVVQGPYCYVRNPMISSVICILLGESLLFRSVLIFAITISFLSVNHLYFILIEEPGLFVVLVGSIKITGKTCQGGFLASLSGIPGIGMSISLLVNS